MTLMMTSKHGLTLLLVSQIRLQAIHKNRVKGFAQWVKDKVSKNEDPQNEAFDVGLTQDLLRRSKTHHTFVEKAKILSDIAKSDAFLDKNRLTDNQHL